MTVESQEKPQYSLAELLEQCDPHEEVSREDREWIDASPVGKEII